MNDLIPVLILGLAAAAVGRLLARDTIFVLARNNILIRVGWLTDIATGLAPGFDDIAAEARNGVHPVTTGPNVTLKAPTTKHALLVEGLTCPSCVAFWILAIYTAATDLDTLGSTSGWASMFASWAVAGVYLRKGE